MKHQNKKENTIRTNVLLRKTAVLAIAGALALSLSACGEKPIQAPSNPPLTDESSASTPGSQSMPQADAMQYYGKIASIAGNEIEFDVAQLPGADEALPKPPKDGAMDAVAMTPATPAGEAGEGAGGAENRVEVKYTGETKSFIIPAGVPITDPAGVEKQLSDLKKGTMLDVQTDKDGNVTQVIYLA